MATTTYLELEKHGSGTVGLSGIVEGNWERLDAIFNPGLSSGDASFGAIWKAVVRDATNPTTQGAKLEWDVATSRPTFKASFEVVTHAASLTIDVKGAKIQEVDVTGTTDFQSLANQAAGVELKVVLRATGGPHNLTFPAGWVFVGGAAPATIGAAKAGILELTTTGTTDATVLADWKVQD